MSLLGNLLWIVLGGGFLLFLEYAVGSLLLCVTIVGIPFGVQGLKLSQLALVPFGKEVRHTRRAAGCLPTVMNLLWLVVAGVWIALTHLVFALLCAVTIVGLPFAKQHMKLVELGLFPFGKEIHG